MIDPDRPRADAEHAEIQSEMAKSRLRYAQATHAALTRRWNDAQNSRRIARQTRRDGGTIDDLEPSE